MVFMTHKALGVVLCVLAVGLVGVEGVARYGHAYQAPADFTDAQYAQIASTFDIMTVEKRHAFGVYGDPTAPKDSPHRYNSYNATVYTARHIKSLNSSTRVLMYWNSALHYNMYECEAAVQPSWVFKGAHEPEYNYSVPAFRDWWVQCAIDSIKNSDGAIDGLFLDAGPKVAVQNAGQYWGEMMDKVRAAVGPEPFLVYNGLFLSGGGVKLAGADYLSHASAVYAESLATLAGPDPTHTLAQRVEQIMWVANVTAAAFPTHSFVGHGKLTVNGTDDFVFGFAVFLLVTPSPSATHYLANNGYNVDEGLLEQPADMFGKDIGEPLSGIETVGPYTLSRKFVHAVVTVDLAEQTADIAWH